MTAEDYEEELRRRQLDAARSEAHGLAERVYHVATVIVARWAAAGFTTARLVDGLPRPERGHPGEWIGEGWARHCATCARPWGRRGDAPLTCPGPHPFDLVHAAVARGVPFGLVDGLPTAGEPIALDGILVKVAAATVAKAA